MLKTRIRHRRLMLIAVCFVGLFVFSSLTPLDNSRTSILVTPDMVRENHVPSEIDFSAQWNRTYGGFDNDRFYDMVLCDDGGFAFVGQSESFASDRDTWVVRTDEEGNPLWTKNLGYNGSNDQGNSIYQCENGDFVIAGVYSTAGGNNGFVIRITDEREVLWTYEFGLDASLESFNDVIETGSGAIVAVGTTEIFGPALDDVLVVALSSAGSPIWTRAYGGLDDDLGRGLVESKDGGVAVLANTYSFGAGGSDFWLLRLDVDGNPLWNNTYGGGVSEGAYDIIEYSPGGFVMVGQTRSFGDPLGDFYVVRVDSDGGLVWDEFYGDSSEEFATGVVEALNGGFTIVGISDYIGINPQARITRIEPDSTESWSDWYGGSNVDYGYELVEVHPEEYVVGGTTRSYGAGDFDGWTFLVPGKPQLIEPPGEQHFEFGSFPSVILPVESSSQIHMWWLEDTTTFDIVAVGDEGHVYTLSQPDVGFYEIWVHVNNTAGHETEHIFWIYVDDTTAPSWSDYTAEHFLEFGDQFQYAPSVYDLSLLGDWFLTGSTYFSIDMGSGEISNVGTPPVGEYNLEIMVNDRYHNILVDSLQIVVEDTTAPTWDATIQDQQIDYGVNFVYDLDASDLAGIASWSVDNTEFSVDSEGRVRNLITLAPGEHAVTVSVTDVHGNVLQGQFVVTVGSAPTTPGGPVSPGIFDSALPFVAGVGATIVVVALVCAMGRRKTPTK
ncbi:MAG: hypothetical protein ACXACG_09930 [Candidatus Thorarchaeota archaeon]|jgi:hypothetical protein